MSHVRCPVCRHNLGDPDDDSEHPDGEVSDSDGEEGDGGRGESTIVIIDTPTDGSCDNEDDHVRMIQKGTELAESIKQERKAVGWKLRKEEWTGRVNGVGGRKYLLRGHAILRPRSGAAPHVIHIEPHDLRHRKEIEAFGCKGGQQHRHKPWRTNRKPSAKASAR